VTPTGDTDRSAAEPEPAPAPPRRLVLADPVPTGAGEDRPESWGEQVETDSDRLRFYQQQRPPHHGG
jgi:hypothetical protein